MHMLYLAFSSISAITAEIPIRAEGMEGWLACPAGFYLKGKGADPTDKLAILTAPYLRA